MLGDGVGVDLGSPLDPEEAAAVVGSGHREQVGLEGIPVSLEGRPDDVPDDGPQLVSPALLPVPFLRTAQVDEDIGLQRRGEVPVEQTEAALHVDAGGRSSLVQCVAKAIEGLVQGDRDGPQTVEDGRGVGRFGKGPLGGGP